MDDHDQCQPQCGERDLSGRIAQSLYPVRIALVASVESRRGHCPQRADQQRNAHGAQASAVLLRKQFASSYTYEYAPGVKQSGRIADDGY